MLRAGCSITDPNSNDRSSDAATCQCAVHRVGRAARAASAALLWHPCRSSFERATRPLPRLRCGSGEQRLAELELRPTAHGDSEGTDMLEIRDLKAGDVAGLMSLFEVFDRLDAR